MEENKGILKDIREIDERLLALEKKSRLKETPPLNKEKIETQEFYLNAGIDTNPGGDWKHAGGTAEINDLGVILFYNRKDGNIRLFSSKFFE